MANLSLSFLLLFTFLATATSTTPKTSTSMDFIRVSCSTTRYPAVCVSSLSIYAPKIQQSKRQLAQTALSVSLLKAQSAATFVSQMLKAKGMKGEEYQCVKDCVDNMGDSVDRLSKSIKELGQMGQVRGQDFIWHMSNVQTWVSAALTDENTCMDGFASRSLDGKVKVAVRGRVVNVAQVTSNALALVNRFASV